MFAQVSLCAVVFGKGRVAVPILRGAEITSEALNRMFAFLRANASDCTPDAVYLPGSIVDMIMPWNRRLDALINAAIAKSGAVPDLAWNEASVDRSTGQVVENTTPNATAAASEPAVRPASDPDTTVASSQTAARPAPSPAATAQPPRPKPSKSRPAWVYSTVAVAGVLVVGLIVTGVVFFKRRTS